MHLQRLGRGAALQLAGKLTGRGVGFLAHMVVARTLGAASYGVYGIGWTLFQLVGLVASLGLEHGAVFYASRDLGREPVRSRAVLYRCLALTLVSGALFGGGLALAAPLLARRVFSSPELEPVLYGFAAGVVLVAGTRVAAAATRVSQRMRYSTLAEDLVLPLGHLLLLLALLALGWRLLAAVVAPLAAHALALAVALACFQLLFGPPPAGGRAVAGPSTRALLGYSVATSLSGILGLLTLWADRLLVGYFLPETEVGIYILASQVALLFTVVLAAFNTVFAPMIAELHGSDRHRELGALYRASTKWGIYVTLPLFLVVSIFPEELLALLGTGYAAGAPALRVLALGQMANLATGAVGFLLTMSGRQNRLLALSATSLSLNLVLNVLWIPRLGIVGAALATAVSLVLLFALALASVRRGLGLWPWDRRLAKGGLAALAAAGGLALLHWGVDPLQAWHLAAAVLLAYGVFAGVLALLGLDPEDRDLLSDLLRFQARGGTPR